LSLFFLALNLALSPQGATPPPASDPFAAGLRWSHRSEVVTPWIPRDACFVGGGELVWAAPALPNPSLRLLSTAELGLAEPLFQDSSLIGALGEVRVAAGDTPAELFAAAQYPAPTSSSRRTMITRHDALAAALGTPSGSSTAFLPSWTHDMGLRGNGPARLVASPDGAFLFSAAFDATTQIVQVDRLDPATGVLLARASLPATGLAALSLTDDGALVAVGAGTRIWVLDEHAAVVWSRTLATGSGALDLSADGALLVYGAASRLEVLELGPGGYAPAFGRAGAPTEVAVGVDLAADGSTVAVSWWDLEAAWAACRIFPRR